MAAADWAGENEDVQREVPKGLGEGMQLCSASWGGGCVSVWQESGKVHKCMRGGMRGKT